MKPKENQKLYIGISVVAALVLISATVFAFTSNNEQGRNTETGEAAKNVPQVEVVNVENFEKEQTQISSIGKVEALNQVSLRTQLNAEVKSINFGVGDPIRKGDIVIKLDDSDILPRLSKAKAALDRTESNLAKTEAGATTQKIQSASSSLAKARSQLKNKKENLKSIKQQTKNRLEDLYGDTPNLLTSAYNKANNAVRNKTEDFFTGDETDNPQLSFYTSSRSSEIKAESQREKVGNMLDHFKEEISGLNPENRQKVDEILKSSEEYLNEINKLLLTLEKAANSAITSSSFPESELTTYKTNLEAAKNEINAATSNIKSKIQQIKSTKIENQNQLNNARDAVTTQEKTVEQLQSEYENLTAPAREVDTAPLRASIREARANKQQIERELEKTKIRSPFTGEVASIDVDLNELVNPGDKVASLVNKSGLKVTTHVSPKDKKFISKGAKAEIAEEASGSVSNISSRVDPQTNKIEVGISINKEVQDLVPGQYVQVEMQTSQAENTTGSSLLPFNATKITPEGDYVFVVNENNKIEKREIELGRVINEYNEVKGGLTPEMKIIKDLRGLSEGQKVEVKSNN